MNKAVRFMVTAVIVITAAVAGILGHLRVRTEQILTDYSGIYEMEEYQEPVYVEGVEVITQHVSCGYACIQMFSAWAGGDITEDSLFEEYGKVVTSTGPNFAAEMNKRFPDYVTTMHKYLTNTELIDLAYRNLASGVPVPFEWAAKYGDDWTLHYSLLIGMDIPGDKITVANPYGYLEEITVEEFLNRTSFEAYEKMPLYFKLAFGIGLFEKNTIFTVQ